MTSGTTGQTLLDVAQVIEHAFRRATGGLAGSLSAEQLRTAQENLFLGLTAFVNKGLSLWCIKKHLFALEYGKRAYALPIGSQDVLQVMRRDGTYTAATALALSLVTMTYSADTQVDSAILALPAGTATWVLESSPDNATWTQRGSYSGTLDVADKVSIDAETQVTVTYWRARQTVGADTPTSATFADNTREIDMTIIARDMYTSLPNKLALGTPVQFQFSKQFNAPTLNIWQVPNTTSGQLVVTTQDVVEDVGDLSNNLAVPARWLDAIISDLAVRTYLELPKQLTNEKLTLSDLRDFAKEKLDEAANSETDGAPIFMTPNISVYTR